MRARGGCYTLDSLWCSLHPKFGSHQWTPPESGSKCNIHTKNKSYCDQISLVRRSFGNSFFSVTFINGAPGFWELLEWPHNVSLGTSKALFRILSKIITSLLLILTGCPLWVLSQCDVRMTLGCDRVERHKIYLFMKSVSQVSFPVIQKLTCSRAELIKRFCCCLHYS